VSVFIIIIIIVGRFEREKDFGSFCCDDWGFTLDWIKPFSFTLPERTILLEHTWSVVNSRDQVEVI